MHHNTLNMSFPFGIPPPHSPIDKGLRFGLPKLWFEVRECMHKTSSIFKHKREGQVKHIYGLVHNINRPMHRILYKGTSSGRVQLGRPIHGGKQGVGIQVAIDLSLFNHFWKAKNIEQSMQQTSIRSNRTPSKPLQ